MNAEILESDAERTYRQMCALAEPKSADTEQLERRLGLAKQTYAGRLAEQSKAERALSNGRQVLANQRAELERLQSQARSQQQAYDLALQGWIEGGCEGEQPSAPAATEQTLRDAQARVVATQRVVADLQSAAAARAAATREARQAVETAAKAILRKEALAALEEIEAHEARALELRQQLAGLKDFDDDLLPIEEHDRAWVRRRWHVDKFGLRSFMSDATPAQRGKAWHLMHDAGPMEPTTEQLKAATSTWCARFEQLTQV